MSIADWLWETGWAWPVLAVCVLVLAFTFWAAYVMDKVHHP